MRIEAGWVARCTSGAAYGSMAVPGELPPDASVILTGGVAAKSAVTDNGWEYSYDAGANGHWINSSAARNGNLGTING